MKYNRFMGEYDDNTIYQAGDVVNFDGASYYRKVPGKGISPIARKKPYTVWSRLNEALSTIFPLGGGGGSLPPAAPYQQLVTDGDGNWGAEERLAWKTLQKGSELIPETEVSFRASSGMMAGDAPLNTLLVAGEKYVVNWDGKEYVSTCQTASEGFPILGNYSLYDPATENTGEPFCAVQVFSLVFYTPDEAPTHTVGLSAMSETVRTVPPEYLPFPEPIIFRYDGTEYSCSVNYATFRELMAKGAAMMYVSTASGAEIMTSRVSARYDADINAVVIYAYDGYSGGDVAKLVFSDGIIEPKET